MKNNESKPEIQEYSNETPKVAINADCLESDSANLFNTSKKQVQEEYQITEKPPLIHFATEPAKERCLSNMGERVVVKSRVKVIH